MMLWLPYTTGNSIIFESDTEEFVFQVLNSYKSEEESHFAISNYICNSYGKLETNENPILHFSFNMTCYENELIELIFSNSSNFFLDASSWKDNSSDFCITTYFPQLQINNRLYLNVYVMENDTLRSRQDIWMVCMAEFYGLIQFKRLSDGMTYSLK